jgi:N-acetylmuramoyl-L-alanine amidase
MTPHTIFIHCTATRPNWWDGATPQEKVEEVRNWHVQDNGWSDIGYHWLIDRDGTVVQGRPETRQGAHAKGHNRDTLAVSLFGGHGSNASDNFADHFTPAQDAALRALIEGMQARHPTLVTVRGHNEVSNKACPGFQVAPWLTSRTAKVERKSPAQSSTLQATASAAVAGSSGLLAAIGKLDPQTQIIVSVCGVVMVAALAWIARERLRKWAAGDK